MTNSKPVLTCLGGVGTVTGANFMLEIGSKRYLIDCGLAQGLDAEKANGESHFDYEPAEIEALFITHAHIDHIGRIPRLVAAGYKHPIYSTPATKEIAAIMLADLAPIEGLPPRLVEASMSLWQTISYREKRDFGGFELEPFDSGHILGAAMYKFTFPSGGSVVFTGDLGNSPSPLLKPTESFGGADYILMESVYGDRNHAPAEERDEKFRTLIKRIVEKRQTLIVPVFSLERTQLLLYELRRLHEAGELKHVPVYLDSPLAIRLTEVYRRLEGEKLFDFPELHETPEASDSMALDRDREAKIILAGSGMSTAGRILFHEERYLPDPQAVILFVGYQAAGTLGRQIEEGAKEVLVDNKKVRVRAEVVSIDGYSAHAGSDQLVDFIAKNKKGLKEVFVAMGEPKASIFLAQRLHDELGVRATLPKRGRPYELDL